MVNGEWKMVNGEAKKIKKQKTFLLYQNIFHLPLTIFHLPDRPCGLYPTQNYNLWIDAAYINYIVECR